MSAPVYLPDYRHPQNGYYMIHQHTSMPYQHPPTYTANAHLPPAYLRTLVRGRYT